MQEPDPYKDIVYIYKDGPELPDPELSGSEQIRQQQAYIDSFANFEMNPENQHGGRERGGANGKGSDGDELSDIADDQSWIGDDVGQDESDFTKPLPEPSGLMLEMIKREEGVKVWQDIQIDLNKIQGERVEPEDHLNSINVSLQRQEEEPQTAVLDLGPNELATQFPRFWPIAIHTLQSDRSPQILYATTIETVLRPAFKDWTSWIRSTMRKRRDQQGITLDMNEEPEVEQPTLEDEESLLDWLEDYAKVRTWIEAGALVWRIHEAFHEYGFPESKTINTSVNEASLAKLVRTFESARSQAQPLLDRLIIDSGVPGEWFPMVEYVVTRRVAFRSPAKEDFWTLNAELASEEETLLRVMRVIP